VSGTPDAAAEIRLVIFDVDGVFTNGLLYLSDDGTETKTFNVKDGHGVKLLMRAGVEVAIISGRRSAAVDRRMEELGVRHVFQGIRDKLAVFRDLIGRLGIEPAEVAYLGDDLPDLDVMRVVGLPAATGDAHPDLLPHAVWTSARPGGHGAVREFCDLLLAARAGAA
jgi:3-deoxy-D-manno-octulosonate 8-phosphate phosphatase (KDO 8-P phosphatase)